jgi:putative ABC transport system substrate-binding protein
MPSQGKNSCSTQTPPNRRHTESDAGPALRPVAIRIAIFGVVLPLRTRERDTSWSGEPSSAVSRLEWSRCPPWCKDSSDRAAHRSRVTLLRLGVRSLDELDSALNGLSEHRSDAVLVTTEPFTILHRKRIVDALVQQRIPAMFEDRSFVTAGGLMSYGPDIRDNFRQAASYVDRILKGAKPADLPVSQPSKFELVINLTTAKALGLTLPQSVVLRADEVIQ